MLYAFAFDRIAVVVSDLYFVNPDPEPGQEGAEQGVRLEVRLVTRGERVGSIYAAHPIVIEHPIWRADLLESVTNPGSLDRAHHHPHFRGWEPGRRHFTDEMGADPVGWVGARLGDLDGLLDDVDASPGDVGENEAALLRGAVPEILQAVNRLLEGVRRGDLGRAPAGPATDAARVGWL